MGLLSPAIAGQPIGRIDQGRRFTVSWRPWSRRGTRMTWTPTPSSAWSVAFFKEAITAADAAGEVFVAWAKSPARAQQLLLRTEELLCDRGYQR